MSENILAVQVDCKLFGVTSSFDFVEKMLFGTVLLCSKTIAIQQPFVALLLKHPTEVAEKQQFTKYHFKVCLSVECSWV